MGDEEPSWLLPRCKSRQPLPQQTSNGRRGRGSTNEAVRWVVSNPPLSPPATPAVRVASRSCNQQEHVPRAYLPGSLGGTRSLLPQLWPAVPSRPPFALSDSPLPQLRFANCCEIFPPLRGCLCCRLPVFLRSDFCSELAYPPPLAPSTTRKAGQGVRPQPWRLPHPRTLPTSRSRPGCPPPIPTPFQVPTPTNHPCHLSRGSPPARPCSP